MKGKAALFTEVGKPLEFREFPIGPLEKGALWVKITMSTVCGSDLHTYLGHRSQAMPSILGHEIIGEIMELGEGVAHDSANEPVKVGDRITWTIFSACGKCYWCKIKGLPFKCSHLFKYGHDASDQAPYFNGGFGEYCYITPGTFFFKIPDELTDEEVTPANCALATVMQAADTIGIEYADNVMIIGAGALGNYAAAVIKERGVNKVILTDVIDSRLDMAREFGADVTVNVRGMSDEEVAARMKEETGGFGVDVVLEVCGRPEAVPTGLDCLRKGGRFAEIGNVFPGANWTYDSSKIIFNWLTIKGVHNYDALQLWRSIQLLVNTKDKYPYKKLVGATYSLDDIQEAMKLTEEHKHIRVAVVP